MEHYVANVERGRVLYEMAEVDRDVAVSALKLAAAKLPVKTKIIIKNEDLWAL